MFFIPKHGTGNIWIKDCHTEIGHSKSFARLVGDVLFEVCAFCVLHKTG